MSVRCTFTCTVHIPLNGDMDIVFGRLYMMQDSVGIHVHGQLLVCLCDFFKHVITLSIYVSTCIYTCTC